MIKYIFSIACLLSVIGYSHSQDTINFKLFDSLKTSAEDNHKHHTVPNDSIEMIAIRGKLIDTSKSNIIDTAALRSLNLDSWPSRIFTKQQYDSLKTLWENSYNRYLLQNRNTKTLNQQDPDNFDVSLFRTINNARSPFKDEFLDLFSRSTLPVSILFPVSLFTYSRIKEKTYDENSAYLLTISEAANLAVTFGTKMFIKRKRPVNSLPNCYCLGGSKLDMFSFPSGHTSMSFAIATMFTFRYPKYPQIYAPMYAYALIVAYSRPYFARHYPSDLLGGAIIGAGSSVLIYSLRKEIFKLKNNVLSEDKSDNGSINGGVLSFFAGSFIASTILNTTIFRQKDKVTLSVLPSGTDGFGMNLNWRF